MVWEVSWEGGKLGVPPEFAQNPGNKWQRGDRDHSKWSTRKVSIRLGGRLKWRTGWRVKITYSPAENSITFLKKSFNF